MGGTMSFDIIGAGFGRTGTLSLKGALEKLGFGPCYHMVEVFENPQFMKYWGAAARGEEVDWHEVVKGYRSGVDWPLSTYYAELAEAFPEAKVVLSVRDPKAWFKSLHATIFAAESQARFQDADTPPDMRDMGRKIMIDTFDGKNDDEAHAIAVFNKHIEEVKRTIPAERLLVYEVGSGWEPLCTFLGVPVPDTPYPSVNSTKDFQERSPGAATKDAK
jgi:hypothetical protein